MAKKDTETIMVWSDKEGTYKLGYSQFLQMEQNRLNRYILVALVVLIILLVLAMAISYTYVSRLDQMDAISKMIAKAAFVFM